MNRGGKHQKFNLLSARLAPGVNIMNLFSKCLEHSDVLKGLMSKYLHELLKKYQP